MPISLYLAIKYLKNKILLILPIIGLTLGTATLVVVHSVMKGFAVDLEKIAKGLSTDLIISHYENDYFSIEEIQHELQSNTNIAMIIPSIETFGIIKVGNDSKPVKLWALPINTLPKSWYQYFYPSVYMKKFKKLYGYLGCGIYDTSSYLNRKAKFFSLLPTGITLPIEIDMKIIGNFCTNLYEYDNFYLIVNLKDFQKKLSNPKINVVYLQVKNIKKLKKTAIELNKKLNKESKKFHILSGTYEKMSLLTAVEVERNITQIIITLILITTGFGFGSLLYTLVANKTKEIGYLKSLGTTNIQIFYIFVIIALTIALNGSIFGTTFGYLFAKNINEIAKFLEKYTGFQLFPPQEYLFYSIPYYWSWQWIGFITSLNIVILLLASLLPAIKAVKLNPALTLKNE